MAKPKWHYASLSRTEAEEALAEAAENGAFLVRDSESVEGASVLSVYCDGRIHHYRLHTQSDGSVLLEGDSIARKSLQALVDFSSEHKNLVTKLTTPVIINQEEEDDDEEDDEDDSTSSRCTTVEAMKRNLPPFNNSDSSDLPLEFYSQLQNYINTHVCKDSNAVKASLHPPGITHWLYMLAGDLESQLKAFSKKTELLLKLFNAAGQAQGISMPQLPPPNPHEADKGQSSQPLQDLADQLQYTGAIVRSLDRQCHSFLKMSTCEHTSDHLLSSVESSTLKVNSKQFAVRKVETVKTHATILAVNVTMGTVTTGKGGGLSDDDKTYAHDEVVQLIKSRSNPQRLGIQFRGKHRKNYIFEDMQAREDFCQLVQMMKNKFQQQENVAADESSDSHFQVCKVFIGTFNMGECAAPPDLSSWFRCKGQGTVLDLDTNQEHDIVAIGTQESGMSENDWKAAIKRHLGDSYQQVAMVKLLQIRLIVLARSHLMTRISHVETSSVPTGLANKLGNKGGVGVSFFLGQSALCFVNCHLAANAEKEMKRNANVSDILSRMQLDQKRLGRLDITNKFHHVFWFGDMNYRLNLPVQVVLDRIKSKDYAWLINYDQLTRQRSIKNILYGFEEGEIGFQPSYRYKRGTRDVYAYEKQKSNHIKINVPSWCDRILWRSFPNEYIKQTSYGCTTDITTSDHSPVFATFDIGYYNQYVSQYGTDRTRSLGALPAAPSTSYQCRILLTSVEAKLKTASACNFILELNAPYLETSVRTLPNSQFVPPEDKTATLDANATFFSYPRWASPEIPALTPLIPERAYLENEHLLVSVLSEDGDDSYGEGCLSLMFLFSDEPVPFKLDLTQRGRYTGELQGFAQVAHAVGDGKRTMLHISAADEDDAASDSVDMSSGRVSGLSAKSRRDSMLSDPGLVSSQTSASSQSASPPPPVPSRIVKRPPALPPRSAQRVAAAQQAVESSLSKFNDTEMGVVRFLDGLGLRRYADTLISEGYDNVEFLGDLDSTQLQSMGISNPVHVDSILAAIQERDSTA